MKQSTVSKRHTQRMKKQPDKAQEVAENPTSLRSDLKRFTRERLLSSAMQAFTEQGYRATTVERIVELAGTTATTFYRHFGTKTGLLPALRSHLSEEVMQVVSLLGNVRKHTPESIRLWMDDYVLMWRRVHLLCEAHWEASAIDPEFGAEALPSTLELTQTIEAHFQDASAQALRRASLRFSLLLLLLDRVVFLAESALDDDNRSEILDEFSQIIYTSVFAPQVELRT